LQLKLRSIHWKKEFPNEILKSFSTATYRNKKPTLLRGIFISESCN